MSMNAVSAAGFAQPHVPAGTAYRNTWHGWPMLARAISAYRRRAVARELNALDDRMLADIGLRRGDIVAALAESERPA
ncbi:MAG: DUF1127 domain-containing protein [Alphaproteobacteria bacterium]|nr:DUF1127 domain-containing protein [Alphaproteobacteria bacterium]